MFSMSEGMAEALTVIVELLVLAIPVVGVCFFVAWLVPRGIKPAPVSDLTLDVVEQLRVVQDQLEDAHARIDSAERLIAEQHEQLRHLDERPHRTMNVDHATPA